MKDVTGLLVVMLLSLAGGTSDTDVNSGYCLGNGCYELIQDPSDFSAAQARCKEKGGHLMTIRSSVSHDVLSLISGNLTGRFWIGLHLKSGCPDAAAELKGFQWVTEDSESDFFNWAPSFDSSCSSPRCVSVSRESGFKWIQEECNERAAGFLCEYSITDPCRSLSLVRLMSASVIYITPMGFRIDDGESLPAGTTATHVSSGTKYLCYSQRWMKAPWNCEIFEGGCEHKCADPNEVPSCYCPPGQTVNPKNRVACEEDIDNPCASMGCDHACLKEGDTYACTCDQGYKLADDGRSCVDFNDCTDQRQCGENFKCINTIGGFQCVCKDGYVKSGNLCVDEDECVSAPCEHECHNTPGGYECSCFDGYIVDPAAPNKCKLHCGREECPAECDPNDAFQCYCPEGYVAEERVDHTVCIDMDECSFFYCDQLCTNTYGSYVCDCDPGYKLVEEYKCVKVMNPTDTDGGLYESTTTPNFPTASDRPDPTRQPSGVSVGAFVGIILCTIFFIVLVVFLAYHILDRRGKMESNGALKAHEGEAHGLHHVSKEP